MKTGLDQFLAEVKSLTRQKPPFNEAFTSRCVNVLHTAVTIIEGLNTIIQKDREEKEKKIVEKDRPKGAKPVRDLKREAAIIADHKAGMKKAHIAEKIGVTPARISQILTKNGYPPKRWDRSED